MEPSVTENESGPLVLVVDDDDDIRDILAYGISASGCRCLTANSAESALEVLPDRQIEVVISDIHMEGMSGIDLDQGVPHPGQGLPPQGQVEPDVRVVDVGEPLGHDQGVSGNTLGDGEHRLPLAQA